MKAGVLINGVPASGKSTLAAALSAETGWPLLTADTVKEALFSQVGAGDRDYNRKLGRAAFEAVFALIAEFPADITVIVDAWFGFQPSDFVLEHIGRAGFSRVAEVWCHAPPALLAERYRARVGRRSIGHPGLEYVPELMALAGRASPLGTYPRIDIDTGAPPAIPRLAADLRLLLSR
jgi:glucokinase